MQEEPPAGAPAQPPAPSPTLSGRLGRPPTMHGALGSDCSTAVSKRKMHIFTKNLISHVLLPISKVTSGS